MKYKQRNLQDNFMQIRVFLAQMHNKIKFSRQIFVQTSNKIYN